MPTHCQVSHLDFIRYRSNGGSIYESEFARLLETKEIPSKLCHFTKVVSSTFLHAYDETTLPILRRAIIEILRAKNRLTSAWFAQDEHDTFGWKTPTNYLVKTWNTRWCSNRSCFQPKPASRSISVGGINHLGVHTTSVCAWREREKRTQHRGV